MTRAERTAIAPNDFAGKRDDLVEARFLRAERWTTTLGLVFPFAVLLPAAIRLLPETLEVPALLASIAIASLCVGVVIYKWWLLNRHLGKSARLDAMFRGAILQRTSLATPWKFWVVVAVPSAVAIAFAGMFAFGVCRAIASVSVADFSIMAAIGLMALPFAGAVSVIVMMRRAALWAAKGTGK